MSEPRYAGGSEARGKKLRQIVSHSEWDATKGAPKHIAWLWWCPGCDEPHRCDARWQFNGNPEAPTFAPSVLVTCEYGEKRERRRCHSFVRDGKIQFLTDCTHALRGQTVDLHDWPSQ